MGRNNQILITGKTGTVGSNLRFGFGYGREHDLRNFERTMHLIKGTKPEAIVHCAARVPSIGMADADRYAFFYDNLLINANVIEAARQNAVPRVLSILSTWMLQDISIAPIAGLIHANEPLPVYLPYGYSKRILEVHSRMCYECFGLKYNSILPTNIYGINDNFNLSSGHVIAALIHKAYIAKKEDKEFLVWGDGAQHREFLFASDLAAIIEWALEHYLDKEPLVVSNHVGVSIRQIATIIAEYMGISNRFTFDERQPVGQKNVRTQDHRLDSLWNFQFTPIESGIAQTIDWFLAHYPNVRL